MLKNGKKELIWEPEPIEQSKWRNQRVEIKKVAVLLDGSDYAAQAIPMAKSICETLGAKLILLSHYKENQPDLNISEFKKEIENYLCDLAEEISRSGIPVNCIVQAGSPAEVAKNVVEDREIDLVVLTTRGRSGVTNWLSEGLSSKIVRYLDIPVLLVQTSDDGEVEIPDIKKLLVALDGSISSEATLPYARALGKSYGSKLQLVCVPAVPESIKYRAPAQVIRTIRQKAVKSMKKFSEAIARSLREDNLEVEPIVTGSIPSQTIVELGKKDDVDLIMITSQGRGGLDLLFMGSTAQNVVQKSNKPVFIVPVNK